MTADERARIEAIIAAALRPWLIQTGAQTS